MKPEKSPGLTRTDISPLDSSPEQTSLSIRAAALVAEPLGQRRLARQEAGSIHEWREIGIRLAGGLRAVTVTELGTVVSPDGAPARAVRISFELADPDNAQISRELHQASSLCALDESGTCWWVTSVNAVREHSSGTRRFTVHLRLDSEDRRVHV